MAFTRNAIALTLALGATASAAAAKQTCLARDAIVASLGTKYEEQLVGRGLQGQARLFEVFVSTDSGSWTIIQSFPSGMSCIMAAGTDWLETEESALAGVEG